MPVRRPAAVVTCVAALLALAGPAPGARAQGGPQTGFEKSNGATFTTHEDEVAFLGAVALGSSRMRLTEIGRTAQDRPLHLVEIGAPGPAGRDAARERPTALITCSQHGNEPAGREACLTLLRDLAFTNDPAQVAMLERTTWLFIPSANPDGRAANTRENTASVDINRDHVTLETPEARSAAAAVRDWEPDVALDLHEYGPSQPVVYDDSVLWLWPRNLNTDKAVHDLAITLGRDYLVPAANAAGYTTDEYGQAEVADNDVAQTAGDGDEGIMRNAMGLRHVLGILVETRVDADVRQGPDEAADNAAVQRRRVASHRAVLSGLVKFMAERGAEAARVTSAAAARKTAEGAAQSAPVYFGGADNAEPTAEQTVNPPPCGYRLNAADAAELADRLDLLGIRVSALAAGPFVSLGQRAEPLIPLVLDARGTRHIATAEPQFKDCPAVAAPAGPPLGPPKQPAARCVQPRTLLLKLPKVRGRLVSARVTAAGRRVRVRKGVAYVRLTKRQRGKVVSVKIVQRSKRGSQRFTKRTTRRYRVCAA